MMKEAGWLTYYPSCIFIKSMKILNNVVHKCFDFFLYFKDEHFSIRRLSKNFDEHNRCALLIEMFDNPTHPDFRLMLILFNENG